MNIGENIRLCVLVPVYNNAATIGQVLERVHPFVPDILVVDDGCTDGTPDVLAGLSIPIKLLRHPLNQGKGAALRTGFCAAAAMGFTHVVTLDADGQHFPEDLPLFLQAVAEYPNDILVGCRNLTADRMPRQNTAANRFSNFWFRLQTGQDLSDTQSGYRAYPLASLHGLGCLTSRYEAELELMVLAAWHGVAVRGLPVRVYYAPEGERVSHFRPFWDFFRISVLNTVLTLGALCYGLPLRLVRCFRPKSRR